MIRLHELLGDAARADPRREAVIFGSRTRTYGELHDMAARMAGLLAEWGVQRGDRVALWSPNRDEFLEFFFGVPRAGAVAVPLDHWWTAAEAVAAIEVCRPRVLLAAGPMADALEPERARLEAAGVDRLVALDEDPPTGWDHYPSLMRRAEPVGAAAAVGLDDPALILFTSGSTGRSKGAVHTHADLAHTAIIMSLELGLREGERSLHVLPLFSSCLEHLIPLTLVRATHVVLPTFEPEAVWEATDRHGITHFDGVPTVLGRLLAVAPDRIPRSLRVVSYASEPMPPPLNAAWADRAPTVALVEFYGMIEQLCLTVRKPWEQVSAAGTVGRPMLGARVLITGQDGRAVEHGNAGEVLAATPTLMAGYWQDRQATAQVIRDGFMRTGDLGRFDDQGRLVLEGRIKQVITSGGMTVVPREVEEALLEHPAVLEAAVVGVPDERWGEAVHAYVTLRAGGSADPEDLRRHCRGLLASYKCPKRVHVLADLPRTGIGKISRSRLRAGAEDRNRGATS